MAEVEVVLYSSASEETLKRVRIELNESDLDISARALRGMVCDALSLRSRWQRDEVALYRPLVERPLWVRGVAAVESGNMSWRRLCERFLADLRDDDDVAALLRAGGGSAPKFVVALTRGESEQGSRSGSARGAERSSSRGRSASPYVGGSQLSTPTRSSPGTTQKNEDFDCVSQGTAREVFLEQGAARDGSSSRAARSRGRRAASPAHSQASSQGATGRSSSRCSTRSQGLVARTKTTSSRQGDRSQQQRGEPRASLLQRAAKAWCERGAEHETASGAVSPTQSVIAAPSQHARGTSEGSQFGPGTLLRRRAEKEKDDTDETRHCYVEALRAARRDVERLRGAQQTAMLLNERDEAVTRRAWRRWAIAGEVERRVRAQRLKGCATIVRCARQQDRRTCGATLYALRSKILAGEFARKGAGTAAVWAFAHHRLYTLVSRRAMTTWHRATAGRARVLAHSARQLRKCSRDAARRRSKAAFCTWRTAVRTSVAWDARTSSQRTQLRRVCKRLTRGSAARAMRAWKARASANRKGCDRRAQTCGARWLTNVLNQRRASQTRTAVRKWQALTSERASLERLCTALGKAKHTRRSNALQRECLRTWLRAVSAQKERTRAQISRLAVLQRRFGRFKLSTAFRTWRKVDAVLEHRTNALQRLGARDATRRRKAPIRDAVRAWREGARRAAREDSARRAVKALLREFSRADLASARRCFDLWCASVEQRCATLAQRLALVVNGYSRAFGRNEAKLLNFAFCRWRRAYEASGSKLVKRTVLRLLHGRLLDGFQRWASFARSDALDAVKRRQMRRCLSTVRHVLLTRGWKAWVLWNKLCALYVQQKRVARRCVTRLARRGLVAAWIAWKSWSKGFATLCERTHSTRRVVARVLRACLAKGFARWVSRAWRDARESSAARRVVARMLRLKMATAWRAWLAADEVCVRTRETLTRCVLRMHSVAVASAWLSWLDSMEESRITDAIMRRTLQRMLRSTLLAGFLAWRATLALALLAERQGVTLKRVASRFKRTQLAMAWLRWKEQHALAARTQVEKARTLAKNARLARVFGEMCGHTLRGLLVEAWVQWCCALERQKGSELIMRKVLNSCLKASLRKAYTAWVKNSSFALKTRARALSTRRVARRALNRYLSTAFKVWVRFGHIVQTRNAVVKRVVLKVTLSEYSRAWNAWRGRIARCAKRHTIVRRVVSRCVHKRCSAALEQWREFARTARVEQALMRRVVLKMLRCRLVTAWNAWKAQQQLTLAVRTRNSRVRRCAKRCVRKRLSEAWRWWSSVDSRLAKNRKTVAKVLARVKGKAVCKAYRQWLLFDRAVQRERRVMRKTLLTFVNRASRKGLDRWKDFVFETLREDALLLKTVRRMVHVKLCAALDAWRCTTSRTRERDLAARACARFLDRFSRKQLNRAVRTWASYSSHCTKRWSAQLAARATTLGLMRCVKARLGALAHSKLLYGFFAWKVKCAQHRVVCAHVSKCCRRLANRCETAAWARWVSQVRCRSHQRLAIRKSFVKLQRRHLRFAYSSWLAVSRHTAAQIVACKRLALTQVRVKVQVPFRTWVRFSRRLLSEQKSARLLLARFARVRLWAHFWKWKLCAARLSTQHHVASQRRAALKRCCARLATRSKRFAFSAARAAAGRQRHLQHARQLRRCCASGLLLSIGCKLDAALLRSKSAAFCSWFKRCTEVANARRRVLRCVRCLAKLQLAVAWNVLRCETRAVATRYSAQRATRRALKAARRRHVLTGWRRWKDAFLHVQRSRSNAATCVARLAKARLKEAFRHWVSLDRSQSRAQLVAFLVPKLDRIVKAAKKVRVVRKRFNSWARFALSFACKELAAARLVELFALHSRRAPLCVAFANWRCVAAAQTRAQAFAFLSSQLRRPRELNYAAIAGLLASRVNCAPPAQRAAKRAFRTWKRDYAHRKAAQVLSMTLAAAREALLAAAMERWNANSKRRADYELRLWKKLEHRMVLRAWLHWWTQVEVVRELQSLQRGVRALARTRPHH